MVEVKIIAKKDLTAAQLARQEAFRRQALAREFGEERLPEILAASERQASAQKIRTTTTQIQKSGQKLTLEEFEARGVTEQELKQFDLIKEPPPIDAEKQRQRELTASQLGFIQTELKTPRELFPEPPQITPVGGVQRFEVRADTGERIPLDARLLLGVPFKAGETVTLGELRQQQQKTFEQMEAEKGFFDKFLGGVLAVGPIRPPPKTELERQRRIQSVLNPFLRTRAEELEIIKAGGRIAVTLPLLLPFAVAGSGAAAQQIQEKGPIEFLTSIPAAVLGAGGVAATRFAERPTVATSELIFSLIGFQALGSFVKGRITPKVTPPSARISPVLKDTFQIRAAEKALARTVTVAKRTRKGLVGISETRGVFDIGVTKPVEGRLVSKFITGVTKEGKIVAITKTEADIMTRLGRIDRIIRSVSEATPVKGTEVFKTRFAAVSESFTKLQRTIFNEAIGERALAVGRGTATKTRSLLETFGVRLGGRLRVKPRVAITQELAKFEAQKKDLLLSDVIFGRGAFKLETFRKALQKSGFLPKAQKELFQIKPSVLRERLSQRLPFLDITGRKTTARIIKTFRKQNLKDVASQKAQLRVASDSIKQQITVLERELGVTQRRGIPPITAPRRPPVPIPSEKLGVEQIGLVGLFGDAGIRSVRNLQEFNEAQVSKANQAFTQAFIGGLKSDQLRITKQKPKLKEGVDFIEGLKDNVKSISKEAQKEASKEKQKQKQAQKQMSKQLQKQAQELGLRQVPKQIPFPGIRPTEPITDTRPPRLPPISLGGVLNGRGRTLRVPGWNAIVKRRGKIVKLTTNPVSRTTALSIGGQFVDRGPAASFEIRKTKKNARGPEVDTFQDRAFKFRQRRTKQALQLVEKRRYRIDSVGELEGITRLGNFAQLDKSMLGDMREDMRPFTVSKNNKNKELNLLEVM